jgi:hypothetical protein
MGVKKRKQFVVMQYLVKPQDLEKGRCFAPKVDYPYPDLTSRLVHSVPHVRGVCGADEHVL